MVTTPWYPEEIPMEQAAELGTKKIMDEHCSIGLIVTTDGTVTDIPRAEYEPAEKRSILDMQATGKPFLVLVNSNQPAGKEAQKLQAQLEEASPGLCRPIKLVTSRYNQDLSNGALLVEVGTAGNTHAEACNAAKYLAEGILSLAKGANLAG